MSNRIYCFQPIKTTSGRKPEHVSPAEDVCNNELVNMLTTSGANTLTGRYESPQHLAEFGDALAKLGLIIEGTPCCYLFYSERLETFMALTEITVKVDDLRALPDKLYQPLRTLMVAASPLQYDKVSTWIQANNQQCCETIKTLSKKSTARVLPSTGYIVFFSESQIKLTTDADKHRFVVNNHTIDNIEELSRTFMQPNQVAEHLPVAAPSQLIVFGWQHGTVLSVTDTQASRILLVLFEIQIIYFLVENHFRPLRAEKYKIAKLNNDTLKLEALYRELDTLQFQFNTLEIEKDVFTSNLKPDQSDYLIKIERYWALNKEYLSIRNTLRLCQESLERKLSLNTNRVQKKQSDILFVLAIIQIFSIVSITLDYHQLSPFELSTGLPGGGTVSKLTILKGLGLLSVALIIYAYAERAINHTRRAVYWVAGLHKE